MLACRMQALYSAVSVLGYFAMPTISLCFSQFAAVSRATIVHGPSSGGGSSRYPSNKERCGTARYTTTLSTSYTLHTTPLK